MAWNDDLLEGTPAYQLAASTASVIRTVAGPGSGKSYAIKRRIARLLEQGVNPNKILAITFTRTAAQDLRKEIASLNVQGAEEVHSGTIHSFAYRILTKQDVLQNTGRKTRMLIAHEMSPIFRDINDVRYGNVKEKEKLLSEYVAAWARFQHETVGARTQIQQDFSKELVSWLIAHDSILIGEIIPVAIQYLKNNPLSPEIGKYDHILVDEYQDLNKSEQEFIRLIRGNADITVVGDDDQSIYSFKYAHPEGIRTLELLHGEYTNIPFDECRRCPTKVTKMASKLISNNPNRTLGELKPHINNAEGDVHIIQWPTYEDEMKGLVQIILNEIQKGVIQAKDILVLAPRRLIGYKLRDDLSSKMVPVKSYFRESSIDNQQLRRAYSLMNLLAYEDDLISWRYLLGCDNPSDFRSNQYKKVIELSRDHNISLRETLQKLVSGELTGTGMNKMKQNYSKIQGELETLKRSVITNPIEGINLFIRNAEDESDFFELKQVYKSAIEGTGGVTLDNSNFKEWYREVFDKVREAITQPEPPEAENHVRIMSLHSSKGLSAKFVVVCSMIDPLVPKFNESEALEEQRRLFYVAITRCKTSSDYNGKLIISSFLRIHNTMALRLGMGSGIRNIMASRFLSDFGDTAPASVNGATLLR